MATPVLFVVLGPFCNHQGTKQVWRTGMGALVSFTKGNDDVLPMVILHKQHALHEHGGPDSCNLGSLFPVLPGAKGALRLLVCTSTPVLFITTNT